MKNWAMNMHFNTIPILYYTFSWGGEGAWDAPPKLYIDSVAPPPAFLGLRIRIGQGRVRIRTVKR